MKNSLNWRWKMTCSVKCQAQMEMIGLMAPNFAFMESAA